MADKPDSHDICFIPSGDTAGFLDARLGAGRATSWTPTGAKVGEHGGSHRYTVGQRRGLRLGVPAADGRPRYVLDISPVTNTVTVGPHARPRRPDDHRHPADLDRTPAGRTPGPGPRRSGPTARRCRRAPPYGTDGVEVRLQIPVTGAAPGQAVVLYAGTQVVGSATIAATAA